MVFCTPTPAFPPYHYPLNNANNLHARGYTTPKPHRAISEFPFGDELIWLYLCLSLKCKT